ncbi:HxlR family transcriptional regulator [Clostridioides difficile]|nr:HxlR family transcriptional regulator [Clostridioides difficile]
MDIDNNFEEFPNIEERQKDFNCSIGFTMTVCFLFGYILNL